MLDRKKAPPIRDISQLKLAKPTIHTLDNGIRVYEINMGTQEVLKVELVFNAGRPYEDKKQIARTTARLLREGTKHHNSSQLAEQFEFYGSTLTFPINLDHTNVVLYCLKKYFDQQLPLLAEILTEPIFPQSEIDSLLQNSKQRLQLDLAKNDVVAYRKFTAFVFGEDHPYGYNSSPEIFDSITRKDLIHHHAQNFHGGNCKIFVSGKTDASTITVLNKYLGQIPVKPAREPNALVLTDTPVEKIKITSKDTIQSAIKIGCRLFNRKHEDFYGMFILNTVFGGYFGSRLMTNIREDKGYTYNIFSALDPMIFDGYFYIGTEVGNEFLSDTLKEIYLEMDRLTTELIQPEELQMVRNYLLGNILTNVDGPFNNADIIKTLVMDQRDENQFEILVDTVKNISATSLRTLAQKYLKKEAMWEVVVGA